MRKIREALINSRGEISTVREPKKPVKEDVPVEKSGTAAVLSFLIPGLGQIFTGRFIAAIFWFILVPIGLTLFVVPGIIFHAMNIKDAYDRGR